MNKIMDDEWDDGETSVPSTLYSDTGSRKKLMSDDVDDSGFNNSTGENVLATNDRDQTIKGEDKKEREVPSGHKVNGGSYVDNNNDNGWRDDLGYNDCDQADCSAPNKDNNRRSNSNERGRDDRARRSRTDDKPKEIYIPIERTRDEELFSTTISTGINFLKLDTFEVNVTGEDVPLPINSFELSGLRQHLLENISKSGYTKPTPIQKHAIPIIMKGRDLMGCAQTGSGKTAAFLLPMLHQLLANQEAPIVNGTTCHPRIIIMSPTRELAIQIYEQSKKFAYNSLVKTAVVYGGTSILHQRTLSLKGCHILVATPGRLNDFVQRGYISLASVQFFVLDEADRMLDMGFLPTIEKILGDPTMVTTGERQTLMFSATFPEDIQHLAAKFLYNYIFIAIGIVGSASTDVLQNVYQVVKFKKREKLLELIKEQNCRTVVFVETKRNADFIATYLCENDIKTTSIHGDRLQREREQALWDFKKGICTILVATGVAARGLDIEGIEHVINFDLPKSIDEYVHRIGRTGRVGNRGRSTSFFDRSIDAPISCDLAKILKQAGQQVPDWLNAGNISTYSQSNSFGGVDIRDGDFGKAKNLDSHSTNDEEW